MKRLIPASHPERAPGLQKPDSALAAPKLHELTDRVLSSLTSSLLDAALASIGGNMRTSATLAFAICAAITVSSCMTAAQHRAAVQDDSSEKLTVGTVQRKIQVGMPASEVAAALGSPNIVTTDEQRREVWIYDKIATERAYSTSEGGVSTLILGGALVGSGLVGGAVAPYYGQSAGAEATTQRTLTVIIKFDEEKKVRDFAYHASRF